MAEETDRSQKTEAPSQRRLEEARAKGQLVVSREIATLLLFATAALLSVSVAAPAAGRLATVGAGFLSGAHRIAVDPPGLSRLASQLAADLGWAVLVPLGCLMVAPIAGFALQNAVVWTTTPLQPKLERISPLAGARRLFSRRSLVELLKGIAKLTLVTAALALLLWPELAAIVAASVLPPAPLLAFVGDLLGRTLMLLAVVTLLIAIADYAHQHAEFMREMRMSRRELQDELKQSDGDPHTKQRFRALRLARARRRMIADVPRATVVVTNPTHYAVALRYVAGETGAPEVLAKGLDSLALRIRKMATENGVPVVENAPLARALHAACEVGDQIPPTHYQAVAEIIAYVLRLGERTATS